MTRFAALALARPELHAEFRDPARRFLQAAKESVDAYEPCWHRGPGRDEGYYLLLEKGAGFWCDGVIAPFNYLASTGQVLLSLIDWKKDPRLLDRVRRIATLFQRDCELMPNQSYRFHYWSDAVKGWTRAARWSVNTPEYSGGWPVVEDMSHGAWSVEFAWMCYERGIVFTRLDMERFARTFTRNVWRGEGKDLAFRVDGTGEGGDTIAATRWLDLSPVEPRLFEIIRSEYARKGSHESVYGQALGGYGRMFRWQETLAGRKLTSTTPRTREK
jgi:hypothetical protein